MNSETEQKISRPEFDALYQDVCTYHNSIMSSFDTDFVAEIGRLVVRFARLEETMKKQIAWLIGGTVPSARVATSEASFRNLVSMLGALCFHHFGENTEVNVLLTAINDAEVIRNQFFHSIWFGNDSQSEVQRLKFSAKPRKGVQQSWEGYDLGELKRIVGWIEKIDTTLDGFIYKKFIETQKALGAVSIEVQDGRKITTYPMVRIIEPAEHLEV